MVLFHYKEKPIKLLNYDNKIECLYVRIICFFDISGKINGTLIFFQLSYEMIIECYLNLENILLFVFPPNFKNSTILYITYFCNFFLAVLNYL